MARDDAARQVFALAFGTQKMGRPVAAPPGVPPDRALALQQEFNATITDPEFRDDAARGGLELDQPISGKEVTGILEQIYATPKPLVERFKSIRDGK